MRWERFLGYVTLAVALAQCNEVPVRNLTSSYVVQVEQLRERGSPAKLDVLWVVDDSPSMCQEQQSLASSFNAFLSVFQKYTSIDMRVAVTTTNVCGFKTCSKNEECRSGQCVDFKGQKVCACKSDADCPSDSKCAVIEGMQACLEQGAVRGRFLYQPSSQLPPACRESRVIPCLTDEQCQNNPSLPDSKNWVCDKPPQASQLYTCDMPPQLGQDKYPGDILFVVNSSCRYKCNKESDPAACARIFGKPKGCDNVCPSQGGCSVEACVEDGTFVAPNSCASFCQAGSECESLCLSSLGDAATCSEICSAKEDCLERCYKATKAPHCDQVCQSSWDCLHFCETYLNDPQRCKDTCTSPTCFETCLQKFGKQDFLCFLTCNGASSCSDRCIAEFGAKDYYCYYPGGDKNQAGCAQPAPTAYCPSTSLFRDCIGRCRVLLSRPELGEKDPALHCENICRGGLKAPDKCPCNQIADYERRCQCLNMRDEKGMPICGSGVQCTIEDRCLSWIPPTVEDPQGLSREEQEEREAECASVPIPVLDQLVAERFYRLYKQGQWSGDPSWRTLDEQTVRRQVFERLFMCMASIGAIQSLCGSQEQGLLAAKMALDPFGENREQARAFLRDDAYLLIVVVSDEDDCSSLSRISLIDVGRCPCFADALGCKPSGECDFTRPGPLYPVEWLVNDLKSLKPDPAQVVFAAIVGDAVPGSATSPGKDIGAIRKRFFECKCDKPVTSVNTYVCQSYQGQADLGARYIRVAEAFGSKYGVVSNICDDRGLRPALEQIARLVVPLLTRVCLPRPIEWPCLNLCEETFGDLGRCKKLCLQGQDGCEDACSSLFGGGEGCGKVCRADSFVEVYLVDKDGNRQKIDPLTPESPQSDDKTYYTLDKNAPSCPKFDPAQGYRTENAIRFSRPLEPYEQVEIVYLTSPFYEQETR